MLKKMEKVKRYRSIAIVLTLFTLGSINETHRILTSSDVDIAENRASLIPMAITITAIAIFFTIRFWNKASRGKNIR